jgi:tubulin-specific chaperone C
MPEAKQPAVVDRMKAREAQRVADTVKRHHEMEEAGLGTESAAAFLDNFSRLQAALSADIDSYSAGGAAEPEKAHVLATRISELEQTVASAAYFLPPYDLRNASLAVAAIKDRLETATKTQQPRKKFSFLRKPAAVVTDITTEEAAAPTKKNENTTAEDIHNVATPATATTTAATAPNGRNISGLRSQVLKLTIIEFQESEDVTLSDLEDCTIYLQSPLGALFIHGLARCVVIGGPVAGALHLENLIDCKIYAASRQVRIHSAQNCDFYLKVRSGPIIEFSAGLRFAPLVNLTAAGAGAGDFPLGYPEAAEHLKLQGLDDSDGNDGREWADVQDFGWLRASASPNWSILPEGERQPLPTAPPN